MVLASPTKSTLTDSHFSTAWELLAFSSIGLGLAWVGMAIPYPTCPLQWRWSHSECVRAQKVIFTELLVGFDALVGCWSQCTCFNPEQEEVDVRMNQLRLICPLAATASVYMEHV